MARIDSRSQLKWAALNGAHHDVSVDQAGRIYVLTREKKIIPEINREEPVIEDFVTILSPDGVLVKKISLLRAFEHSEYAPELVPMKNAGDLLHANTVQVLDGSLAAVVAALPRGQPPRLEPRARHHRDPRPGRRSGSSGRSRASGARSTGRGCFRRAGSSCSTTSARCASASRARSRSIPSPRRSCGATARGGQGFYSMSGGFIQRLPNGNTLIVSSNEGRAFEVTTNKEIVWEYRNPFRSGKKDELIATLEQVERLPADLSIDEWARAPAAPR